MVDAKTLRRRFRAAAVAIVIVAFFDVALILAAVQLIAYLRSLPPEAVVDELELAPSEAWYLLAGLLRLIAIVAAAVLFLRWFHAVYRNVAFITGRRTRHDPSWTVWGFVVPFLNVIRPYQLMRETWDALVEHWLMEKDGSASQVPRDWIALWWTLWIASWISSSIVSRLAWGAVYPNSHITVTILEQGAIMIDVVAAGAAVLLVRSVTRLQAMQIEQVASRPQVAASAAG